MAAYLFFSLFLLSLFSHLLRHSAPRRTIPAWTKQASSPSFTLFTVVGSSRQLGHKGECKIMSPLPPPSTEYALAFDRPDDHSRQRRLVTRLDRESDDQKRSQLERLKHKLAHSLRFSSHPWKERREERTEKEGKQAAQALRQPAPAASGGVLPMQRLLLVGKGGRKERSRVLPSTGRGREGEEERATPPTRARCSQQQWGRQTTRRGQ